MAVDITQLGKNSVRQAIFLKSLLDSMPVEIRSEDDHARELLRDGITHIPNYADREDCIELRERLVDLADGESSEATYIDGDEMENYSYDDDECVVWTRGGVDQGMIDMRNADEIIPELKEFRDDEYLLDLVNSVTDKEYVPEMRAYINESVTHTRNYHSDTVLGNPFGGSSFKSFVYLTDVSDPSYGPYSYVKGSHRDIGKRFTNMYLNALRDEPKNEMHYFYPKDAENFLAEVGDVVMSNQAGVHRGIPQEEGKKRVALVITYTTK